MNAETYPWPEPMRSELEQVVLEHLTAALDLAIDAGRRTERHLPEMLAAAIAQVTEDRGEGAQELAFSVLHEAVIALPAKLEDRGRVPLVLWGAKAGHVVQRTWWELSGLTEACSCGWQGRLGQGYGHLRAVRAEVDEQVKQYRQGRSA